MQFPPENERGGHWPKIIQLDKHYTEKKKKRNLSCCFKLNTDNNFGIVFPDLKEPALTERVTGNEESHYIRNV